MMFIAMFASVQQGTKIHRRMTGACMIKWIVYMKRPSD